MSVTGGPQSKAQYLDDQADQLEREAEYQAEEGNVNEAMEKQELAQKARKGAASKRQHIRDARD